MTKGPIDFVLAGCHAGHPLDDLPALPGPWCWFADRWTGTLPPADALTERLGAPVKDWPLAFEEQLQTAQIAPSVLLVRGDPLVATPHRHLVDALKEHGKRVMIRRRLGVAELAAEFAPCKPRVLTASARDLIEDHLTSSRDPLLVVCDAPEQDLAMFLGTDWNHLWLSHLGSTNAFVGRHQPRSDLLSLLLTARSN